MLEINHSTFRDDGPVPPGKPTYSEHSRVEKILLTRMGRFFLRKGAIAGLPAVMVLLLCQCHRQTPAPAPTPGPTPSVAVTPTPSATGTATPTATATAARVPSATPTPQPTVSSTPDPFADGIKQLLNASEKAFLELRGKFKRTENGSGQKPLFRVRTLYEGTFLFGGAVSAEVEEVYFNGGLEPVYNYRLFFQTLSPRRSVERYDDLRQNLNRVLSGFEHTFGDRYDAWARSDPLKTAILLSTQDVGGTTELQVHVAFAKPQW
jgi:hypothetical protein